MTDQPIRTAGASGGPVLAEEAGPDATLEQHCSWWQERTGVGVSTATMSRAITALAWTRKKSR